MTTVQIGIAFWLAIVGFVAFLFWLNQSEIGQDIMTAVHMVIRRRLRIWARGNGVHLWEDER